MRMMKECTVCLQRKPVRSAFRKKSDKADGYYSWCRECEAEEKRAARRRAAATH